MPLQPGARLGPYEIASALGQGGMGEVCRARDTRLDRDVAVKVLSDHLASGQDALGRERREIRRADELRYREWLEGARATGQPGPSRTSSR